MCHSFQVGSISRAIIHVDADSFFASCEQAVNPALKGKPVVTGKERGIASAVSYEAKALGVKRAMPIHEILKVCPDCIYVPSDYELYSLFSTRMFDIVRRYTSEVEEYSIDECFADLTGLRRPLRMTYPAIAHVIKTEIESELGIGVSVGLAPTKVLAKIGSKWNKPSGFTVITPRSAPDYLAKLATEDVWGIGKQTSCYLAKAGILTALQFAEMQEGWVKDNLSKPYQEIWHELRASQVYQIETKKKDEYKSISKTKTFTPPSKDRAHVFAQLSKNIENACIKMRRHKLATDRVFVFLKTQEFRVFGVEIALTSRTAVPSIIAGLALERFDRFFRPNVLYRATGVICLNLAEAVHQPDLFGEQVSVENLEEVFGAIDAIDKRFGKHTVFVGSSFGAVTKSAHKGARGDTPERRKEKERLRGESARKHLALPLMGEV